MAPVACCLEGWSIGVARSLSGLGKRIRELRSSVRGTCVGVNVCRWVQGREIYWVECVGVWNEVIYWAYCVNDVYKYDISVVFLAIDRAQGVKIKYILVVGGVVQK